MTDIQLWLLLKKGDEGAFAALFDRYHATLYNYGKKLCPASTLVEDAVQDLFVDLWRLRGGLTENVESVKFYLYRSLRRKITLAGRRNARSETDPTHESSPWQESHESYLVALEATELQKKRLSGLLEQLSPKQLEALTLKYFEDFSVADIALIMEVNEKSVRNFLFKGLTVLRHHKKWLDLSTDSLVLMSTACGLLHFF